MVPKPLSTAPMAVAFDDQRPESAAQLKVQEMADASVQVFQLRAYQEMADVSPQVAYIDTVQMMADEYVTPQQSVQKKEKQEVPAKANNTGLPDQLKAGIENLSGYSMDDVKVHYNSEKPAQLNAHAYAQGTEIHLGSGPGKALTPRGMACCATEAGTGEAYQTFEDRPWSRAENCKSRPKETSPTYDLQHGRRSQESRKRWS